VVFVNRYKFILNPIAGGGRAKSMMPAIEKYFQEAGLDYEIYQTSSHQDAIGAARRATEEGFNIVVAAGGDGTVNEVLNGIVGSGAALAVIHGGKGNDFALSVNMPKETGAACKALEKAKIKKIDLGKVLNRYFINSVGVGFDATVALRVNRGIKPLNGVSAYIYAVFETLLTYRPIEMEIELGEGKKFSQKPMLVAVGIGRTYGGGMMILPDAIQDDGLLDICVFDQMNNLALAYHFPKVFSGKHVKLKEAALYRSKEVTLYLSEQCPLHMEGEILFGDQMHFTLEQQAMPVVVGG
jgi:diacylglycerol kinase (ATP)